jgi:hypothetical protein
MESKKSGKDVGDWSKVPADKWSARAQVGILNKRDPDSYVCPPKSSNKLTGK